MGSTGNTLFFFELVPTPSHPNITMCLWVLSHFFLSVCVCATNVWSRSSFWLTLFMFLSAGVSETIDHVAYWGLTITDCNQTHFCCQFWLHTLYSWWFWWFSRLFQWFLHLKRMMIRFGQRETKQEQNKQQLCASLCHIDSLRLYFYF